eukprot:scaffold65470_cov17-Tisochrysis_lutea.AAC.1
MHASGRIKKGKHPLQDCQSKVASTKHLDQCPSYKALLSKNAITQKKPNARAQMKLKGGAELANIKLDLIKDSQWV